MQQYKPCYDSLFTLTCFPLFIFCTYFILSIFHISERLFLINKDIDKTASIVHLYFNILGYPQKPPSAGLPWRNRPKPEHPQPQAKPHHLEQQVSPELQKAVQFADIWANKGCKSRTFWPISGRNCRPAPTALPAELPAAISPQHRPDPRRQPRVHAVIVTPRHVMLQVSKPF
jgi:hypothetical protein